jgi:hypothetical protein
MKRWFAGSSADEPAGNRVAIRSSCGRRQRPASARRVGGRGVLLLIAIAALAVACGESGSSGPPPLNTGPAPWPNPDRVADRIAAAGLSSARTESLVVHYHAHLDILVNGKSEPVASSIGREDTSLFSPLHTHATSGMIHIEAPTDMRITLEMFFTEWGVRLTNECVGGYCRPKTPVNAYIDGRRYRGAIAGIVLKKGEEIALVIGSPPATIPSNWNCLANIDPKVEAPWQCGDFGQTP